MFEIFHSKVGRNNFLVDSTYSSSKVLYKVIGIVFFKAKDALLILLFKNLRELPTRPPPLAGLSVTPITDADPAARARGAAPSIIACQLVTRTCFLTSLDLSFHICEMRITIKRHLAECDKN